MFAVNYLIIMINAIALLSASLNELLIDFIEVLQGKIKGEKIVVMACTKILNMYMQMVKNPKMSSS